MKRDSRLIFLTIETSLLLPATWGYVLVAFAGIWLSLAVKYIKKILANFALYLLLWYHRLQPDTNEMESPADTSALVPRQSSTLGEEPAQPLAAIFKRTTGLRDLYWKLVHFTRRDLSWGYWLLLLIFTTLVSAAGLEIGRAHV